MYHLKQICAHILQLKVWFFVLLAVFGPIGLLTEVEQTKQSKCAYVIVVMAILWLTEAIPIPVTALMPIVLFPMLGVVEAKDISKEYITDTTMLFMGGLVLAVAVEEVNLHKRIAVGVMRLIGAHPSMLMLGLMIPTWFLSMWISNTAATSMMIPIIHAVIFTVDEVHKAKFHDRGQRNIAYQLSDVSNSVTTSNSALTDISSTQPETPSQPTSKASSKEDFLRTHNETTMDLSTKTKEMQRLAKALCISVAYGANVGGIATLTGTPPNLVLKQHADELYANMSGDTGLESPISFATWMGFAFPLSVVTLIVAWLWLQVLFLRGRCCRKTDEVTKKAINATIQKQFKELGRVTFAEVIVIIMFMALVVLWLFRDAPNIGGWGTPYYNPVEKKKYVSDSTPAILISILLFVLPARPPSIFCWAEDRDKPSYKPILTWQMVEKKIPWGVIVLLGGGFAIASASKKSGLSMWLGNELSFFSRYDPWLMNLVFALIVAAATEVTSNTATATLLMPVLSALALRIGLHPLYLMIASTIATSFAFMLPVATPPNAIVFSTGYLTIPDMALAGLPMNIMAVLCLTLALNTWGSAQYDFKNVPSYFLATTPGPNAITSTNITSTLAPNVTLPNNITGPVG